jgi:hypothetical protein
MTQEQLDIYSSRIQNYLLKAIVRQSPYELVVPTLPPRGRLQVREYIRTILLVLK